MPVPPNGDFYTFIGIRLPDLVSGFGGGVVNALFFQRAKPGGAIASVIGGAITANYLAGAVARLAGMDNGVAGFVVGVTAMAICQGLFAISGGWLKRFQANPGG